MEGNHKIKFWIAVGIQIAVLFAVLFFYQLQLATGEKVLLKLAPPRDPLSLLQGHYLVLPYEISELEKGTYIGPANFGTRETIYVTLEKKDNYYAAYSVSRTKPSQGKFIKGKVEWMSYDGDLNINYGIEEYFIPETKAMELEKMFREAERDGKIFVQVSLSKSGEALIDKLFIDNEELDM